MKDMKTMTTNEQQPGGITPAAERSEEQVMMELIDIAEDPRVSIRAAFMPNPDVEPTDEESPTLTHQVIVLSVGNLVSISQPAPIKRPFKATYVDEELIVPADATVQ